MDDRANTPPSRPGHPPWKPGESGNPSGRPKGFGHLIREQTKDGQELVEFALSILRGKRKALLKERIAAMEWLSDRGWGKAIQSTEIVGSLDIHLNWDNDADD